MTEQEVERLTRMLADAYPCSQQGCRDTGEQFAALVAEVRRLRKLLREAFGEGFRIQTDESGWSYTERDEPLAWAESDARKAMEGA